LIAAKWELSAMMVPICVFRDSKFQISDSRFQIPDFRFQIPDSRFQQVKVIGHWILGIQYWIFSFVPNSSFIIPYSLLANFNICHFWPIFSLATPAA